MSKTQFTVNFKELEYLLRRYEGFTSKDALKNLIESEMKNIYSEFQPKWEQAWVKHNREFIDRYTSGHADLPEVKESLLESNIPDIAWVGDEASVRLGFDLRINNYRGVISQFVIHGTEVNGSQRAKPDPELLALVNGSNKSRMKRLADEIAKEIERRL